MIKQLIIGERCGAVQACVLEDGQPVELLSGSPEKPQINGNICLGRVKNLSPGLEAAFIDIGLEKNAMLSGEELKRLHLRREQEIIVQIIKLPGGDKGVVVSADIKLAGRFCVLMPYSDSVGVSKRVDDEAEEARLRQIAAEIKPPGMGIILRTDAKGRAKEELSEDVSRLLDEWESILQRADHLTAPALLRDESDITYKAARDIFCEDFKEVVFSSKMLYNSFMEHARLFTPDLADRIRLIEASDIFTVYRLNDRLAEAQKRTVRLKCGGFIVIDRTEAMTVIDVNSGKCISEKDARATISKVNSEAAREIVRQLRLRDIGGIIVVDFINMNDKADRQALLDELGVLAKADRNRLRIVDITPLNLVEMTRKRKNESTN